MVCGSTRLHDEMVGTAKQFVWVKGLLNKLYDGKTLEGSPGSCFLVFMPLSNPLPRSETHDLLLTKATCKGDESPLL